MARIGRPDEIGWATASVADAAESVDPFVRRCGASNGATSDRRTLWKAANSCARTCSRNSASAVCSPAAFGNEIVQSDGAWTASPQAAVEMVTAYGWANWNERPPFERKAISVGIARATAAAGKVAAFDLAAVAEDSYSSSYDWANSNPDWNRQLQLEYAGPLTYRPYAF